MARPNTPVPAVIATRRPEITRIPDSEAEVLDALDYVNEREDRIKRFYAAAAPAGGYKLWTADGEPVSTEEATDLVSRGAGRIADVETATADAEWFGRTLLLNYEARGALTAPVRSEMELRREEVRQRSATIRAAAEKRVQALIEKSGLTEADAAVTADPMLTVKEVADIFRISEDTVLNRAGTAAFPSAVRIGGRVLFRSAAIKKMAER